MLYSITEVNFYFIKELTEVNRITIPDRKGLLK